MANRYWVGGSGNTGYVAGAQGIIVFTYAPIYTMNIGGGINFGGGISLT